MKNTNTHLLGKTIIVKKFGYELRFKVNEIKFVKVYGADMINGVVTQITGSCPHSINDEFGITENELRVAKYSILSKSI